MSIDTQDDLDRIRHARDGSTEEPEDSPEVLVCPIEGCSRTVVGDSGALRNHVTQESDEAHAGIELDDDLNPVKRPSTTDNAPNWGPGMRGIKSGMENNKPVVCWGPGIYGENGH